MSELRIGCGLSTAPRGGDAARAACAEALGPLAGDPVDLAVVFLTPDHADAATEIAREVQRALGPRALIGCTAQGVVGGSREIESPPGVSVWAARLPGTDVMAFDSQFHDTSEGGAFTGVPEQIPEGASLLMLCDPFTYPAEGLLRRFNEDRPGTLVIGGMASGGAAAGAHRLIADTTVLNGGAAGCVVHGRVLVRTLVSQGCRPVGEPTVVTRADRNVILEMGGRPPLERLQETFARASAEERALMQRGMHVGLVVDEYLPEFRRGDFLIRNLIGADRDSGAVAVGDEVGVGNTVQFHVRDAASADEDLRLLLSSVERAPAGALLFTCNGRGTRFFGEPDHDAALVQQTFGGIPMAGLFCAGEIGPVGGRNFLHGYTASLALFEDSKA